MNAYPKRPAHFDRQFLRLLTDSRAFTDIGADGVLLLLRIVQREDSTRYGGPVDYWNSQLMHDTGIKSEDTLARVRQRCVDAGWLEYAPGSRTRPALYFVREPEEQGVRPNDELPQPCGTSREHPQNCGSSEPRTPAPVRQLVRSMCGTSLPSPVPKDIAASAAPAARAKKAPKEKKPRPRNPLFDALIEATGSDPVLNGAHVGKVAAHLSQADPPYTPEEVRAFADRDRWRELVGSWGNRTDRPTLTLGIIHKYLPLIRTIGTAIEPPRIKRAADNPLVNDLTDYAPLGG